mmetsp:Transcript_12452/g.37970  ORF Transcript_12452/g.37970 Transcript_12452/m.37970 type:complete len:287 (+) Transcript_12452:63-923(+)
MGQRQGDSAFSFLVEEDGDEIEVMNGPDAAEDALKFEETPVLSSAAPGKDGPSGSGSRAADRAEAAIDEVQTAVSKRWWKLASYTDYFTLTDEALKTRVLAALAPWRGNMLEEDDDPDLYGPVWIPITLVICISISSEFQRQVANLLGSSKAEVREAVQFHHLILTFVVIMSYVFLVSTALWFARSYYGVSVQLVFTICAYGYSMCPAILGVLLSITTSSLFNSAVFSASWVISNLFLARNVWTAGFDSSGYLYREILNFRKPASAMAIGSFVLHNLLAGFIFCMR